MKAIVLVLLSLTVLGYSRLDSNYAPADSQVLSLPDSVVGRTLLQTQKQNLEDRINRLTRRCDNIQKRVDALRLKLREIMVGDNKGCPLMYVGVNIAGAEFGYNLPGQNGNEYIWPIAGGSDVSYFKGKGMNTVRLPFRWERLQRSLFGPLHGPELQLMRNDISLLHQQGMTVIIDVHNYGRYNDPQFGTQNQSPQPNKIGESRTPAQYADFCEKLAIEFKDTPDLIIGIMNEPNGLNTRTWLRAANLCISAIRKAGAKQKLLVPGNHWSEGDTWLTTDNQEVMLGVFDPENNWAYDIHQYFDSDSSGTSPFCVSPTIGKDNIQGVTQWLRDNQKVAMLSEFGVGSSDTCSQALEDFLLFLEANNDVWLGWQYWAAGPWWGGYFTSIEPFQGGGDKPQMAVLEKHTCNVNVETNW